jgi:hypothetical protein
MPLVLSEVPFGYLQYFLKTFLFTVFTDNISICILQYIITLESEFEIAISLNMHTAQHYFVTNETAIPTEA